MNEPKRFTPAEAIAWLRTKNNKTKFSYVNGKCGCLFTRFTRQALKNKNALVLRTGLIIDNSKLTGRVIMNETPIGFVDFHDEFWNLNKSRLEGKGRFSVSKPEAITLLKQIANREKKFASKA